MWCPNCGREMLDSAMFCMFCGTDLRPFKTAMSGTVTPTPAPAPAPAPTPAPAPAPTPAPAPAPAPVREPDPTPAPSPSFNDFSGSSIASLLTGNSPLAANPTQDRSDDSRAMRHARKFMRYLDTKGLDYTYMHSAEGDHLNGVVRVELGGGSLGFPATGFWVDFDFNNSGEGDSVHISAAGIMSFNRSNRGAALRVCNKVSNERRFARFYLDGDDDLCADVDTWVNDENCDDRTFSLLMLFAGVFTVSYSDFANAR